MCLHSALLLGAGLFQKARFLKYTANAVLHLAPDGHFTHHLVEDARDDAGGLGLGRVNHDFDGGLGVIVDLLAEVGGDDNGGGFFTLSDDCPGIPDCRKFLDFELVDLANCL